MFSLREQLGKGQSKSNCEAIVNWIGNKQSRYDELMEIFYRGDHTSVQRAAWPMSEAAIKHPALVSKHLVNILTKNKQPGNHEAVKRNTVRLFQFIAIPEELHGDIMDMCFQYISSPGEKPAVKAFSLTILGNLSKIYPDIKQEIIAIIEDRWDYETAAFHVRARKVMRGG